MRRNRQTLYPLPCRSPAIVEDARESEGSEPSPGGAGGDEGGEYAQPQVWHEVTIQPYVDPSTGEQTLLVTQCDATRRAETEGILSQMNEVR